MVIIIKREGELCAVWPAGRNGLTESVGNQSYFIVAVAVFSYQVEKLPGDMCLQSHSSID